MSNERFESYTRSASFAVTLSSPMISTLLHMDKSDDLRRRFPWFTEGHPASFGTADELAVQWCTSSIRALVKRGLVDVTPKPPPVYRWEVLTLTWAGRLMVGLLTEAGFAVNPHSGLQVPPHPDDRIPLSLDGVDRPVPVDRRVSMMTDGDLPFMSFLRMPAKDPS